MMPRNAQSYDKDLLTQNSCIYSKPRISRIQVDRQMYPSYAKIRLIRSEIKGFGLIVPEILSEICEDPTYASPTYARVTVLSKQLKN